MEIIIIRNISNDGDGRNSNLNKSTHSKRSRRSGNILRVIEIKTIMQYALARESPIGLDEKSINGDLVHASIIEKVPNIPKMDKVLAVWNFGAV